MCPPPAFQAGAGSINAHFHTFAPSSSFQFSSVMDKNKVRQLPESVVRTTVLKYGNTLTDLRWAMAMLSTVPGRLELRSLRWVSKEILETSAKFQSWTVQPGANNGM